jgi:hypothetical protein
MAQLALAAECGGDVTEVVPGGGSGWGRAA